MNQVATLLIFNEIEVDIKFSVCSDCSGTYVEDWRIVTVWDDEGDNAPSKIEALHARIEADEHERDRIELALTDLLNYDLNEYDSEGDYRYAMQEGM